MNNNKNKVNILWDRVIFAALVFILIIILVVTIISKSSTDDNSDSTTSLESTSGNEAESTDNNSEENDGFTLNENYEEVEFNNADIGKGNLVLVNSTHAFTQETVENVITIYGNKNKYYYVSDSHISADKTVVENLNSMAEAFYKAKNDNTLMVRAGYRSFEDQQNLIDSAKNPSAYASVGYTEFHTGLAVDFAIYPKNGEYKKYDGTGNFSWINENCSAFGFVLRYPNDKASVTEVSNNLSQYRYVGLPHSQLMQKNNLCLEEYIEKLKTYEFGKNPMKINNSNGQIAYEIYYVPMTGTITDKTKVPVPKNNQYLISGDNDSGFIVTIIY